MPFYVAQWKYKSSLGGPWQAGERVELEPELAEAINRDSAGVLALEANQPAARQVSEPPQDRMVKAAPARQDVMTTENMPLAKSYKKKGRE